MTSYSVMPTGSRSSIVATWPGEDQRDHSIKVTTLTECEQAYNLANSLTRLSEGAWNATAWLDTAPVLEIGINSFIERLRDKTTDVRSVEITVGDERHANEWSFRDASRELQQRLPELCSNLSRTQRITIADELAADAASRAEALRDLPHGIDPESALSRVWQMCEVTRSLRNGQVGYLPEAGASWVVRFWGEDRSPAERWGARDQLRRMEQLVAACEAYGGRGDVEDMVELEAHLVIPRDEGVENSIFYVRMTDNSLPPWNVNPFARMTILALRPVPGYPDSREKKVAGHLEPVDDDGFARLLGEWTRLVPAPGHMEWLQD
ncbi:hypothetical protein [Actinophytocola glycyrrhizae]|uniref:Uncharacterized protein n=1 Tax=Actinophytocola glycyrrhizae TaxID=2044873 RepID=A0ABV9SET4_9PSEU